MRFLKKLLVALYIFLGVFALTMLVVWICTRDEPTALITAVFGAAGVESTVSAIMKLEEIRSEERIRKMEQSGGE